MCNTGVFIVLYCIVLYRNLDLSENISDKMFWHGQCNLYYLDRVLTIKNDDEVDDYCDDESGDCNYDDGSATVLYSCYYKENY